MTDLYYWKPAVIRMPSLEIQPNDEGGYIKARYGNIAVVPDCFNGQPPDKATVDLKWGLVSYASFPIFDGTILLKEYTDTQIIYDIFDPELPTMLLDDGLDENGETVQKPLIVGTANHINPQRTGTNTEQKYYNPGFSGTIGTNWSAFDDGVEINTNWTDNGDGTISRSVSIVGTLTFSGTSTMTTVSQFFSWACARIGLTFVDVHNASRTIDHYFDTQERLIDVLDRVAYYTGYYFYIRENILYLLDANSENGSSTIDEYDFVEVIYEWPERLKSLEANWSVNIAKTTAEQGHFIDTEERSAKVFGSNQAVGIEKSLSNVYHRLKSKVETRLTALLAELEKPLITLDLPLTRFPQPYERINFTDNRKAGVTINGYVKISGITLDYQGKSVKVSGRGGLSYS